MAFINPLEEIETPKPFTMPGLEEETTFGGIAKSVGAGLLAGATFLPQTAVSGIEVLEDLTGINLGGEKMDEVVDNAVEFWRKRIGKSKAESLIGQAAETIGAIGTTAAVAPESVLGILAGGAGLEKAAEEREIGTPRLNAYGAGIVQAGTEYLTEKIPIGILQKPGINFLKRLAVGAISDVPGELAATAIEMKIIDEGILGKEPTSTEEFVQALKDTAMVSVISTIGLSGGAQLIDRARPTGEDPTTGTSDALSTIQEPQEGRPAIQTEKQEFHPDDILNRETSKSEYPELASQTNAVNGEEQFEQNIRTQLESGIEESPTVNTEQDLPKTVHETQPYLGNTYAQILEESDSLSRKKRGFNAGKVWAGFVRNFVDVTGNISKKLVKLGADGQRVVMRRNALAGAHSKALKEVDIARKEIFSGLNSNDRKLFNGYLSGLRDLDLRNRFGTDYQLRGNATEQMIRDYIDTIPEKLMPEFTRRTQAWKRRMDGLIDLMTSEGLHTDVDGARIKNASTLYVPRQVLDFIDPEVQVKNKDGKIITVRDSGLKNLTEDGSDKLVETDGELLLEQAYERAWTRVFRNRANLEMLNLARTQPNDIVREAKQKGVDSRGNPTYQDVSAKEAKISVVEDGVRRELILPVELAQEWVKSDPILSATMSNIIGWATGNKILKSMATTLNPEFAITNIPRDLAHIYLTTQEYSSITPIAGLQMASDLKAVVRDAVKAKGIKNTELYKQYIDNGGGTEFLTHQGKTGIKGTTKVTKAFTGLESVMGKAGEFSEIVTRLALMRRAMRNQKTTFEATQVARGYLDFSQGGSVSKAIDTAIPFFNAAVQATRGIVRAAKTDPGVFSAKVFQLTTMAMSLYWANKFMYGDEIDEVDENEQKNNWIIMTPYTFVDKEGEERHYYIRIPKDQGQRVFTAIGEGMAKKALNEPVDGDQIVNAAKDFLPALPTDLLPPAVEALLGYSVNKDFWRREDIWKGDDVLPQEEYNKYTPEVYVQLGEQTGASPVRMKYALEQIFTRGNVWTSLVGYGAKQIFDEMTPEQRLEETKELFERKPFVRRVLRSTRPASKREKEIKEEKIQINTERLRANRTLDELVEAEATGRTDNKEINEYIRRFPVPERKRLRRRRKALRRFRGVRNKGFWFDLLDLPPEQRAVNYWNRWSQLDEAGRRDLDRQSRRVPGFRSKRFNRSFNKMNRRFRR